MNTRRLAMSLSQLVPQISCRVAGRLKYVDPASDLVREARALGISFGDEA